MVVVDSTVLLLLLQPGAGAPLDASGHPISAPRERVVYLISEMQKAGNIVMIPTPVLSEVLVRAPAAKTNQIVEEINKQAVFRIVPFDTLAAIEVAIMSRAAIATGKKASSTETIAKIKYDRQIVAMAKVAQATMIYSDDNGLRTTATHAGIPVLGLADLSLPPSAAQIQLPLAAEADENS